MAELDWSSITFTCRFTLRCICTFSFFCKKVLLCQAVSISINGYNNAQHRTWGNLSLRASSYLCRFSLLIGTPYVTSNIRTSFSSFVLFLFTWNICPYITTNGGPLCRRCFRSQSYSTWLINLSTSIWFLYLNMTILVLSSNIGYNTCQKYNF